MFTFILILCALAFSWYCWRKYRLVGQWQKSFIEANGRKPTREEMHSFKEHIYAGLPARKMDDSVDRSQFSKRLSDWQDNLTVLWAGNETVEFSYKNRDGGRSRRTVDVNEVTLDDRENICLIGYCHLRKEKRTFKDQNITSKIKHRSKRYDLDDWLQDVLDIDLGKLFH